jgi:hypothetical protein
MARPVTRSRADQANPMESFLRSLNQLVQEMNRASSAK